MSRRPFEYEWLGCGGITEEDRLVDPITQWSDMAPSELKEFVEEACEQEHLEETGYRRLTDEEAKQRLCETCKCEHVPEIDGWEKERK